MGIGMWYQTGSEFFSNMTVILKLHKYSSEAIGDVKLSNRILTWSRMHWIFGMFTVFPLRHHQTIIKIHLLLQLLPFKASVTVSIYNTE